MNAKRILYIQLFLTFFLNSLIELGLPYPFRYLTDLVTLLLMVCLLRPKRIKKLRPYLPTLCMMALWWGFMVISTCVAGEANLLWMLWASRNWCRGFIFFAASLVIMEKPDYMRILHWIKALYIINFFVVLIQYFVFDCEQDTLGGIFGTRIGCNGQSNVFLCIFIILVLYEAFAEKKCSVWSAFYIVSSFAISGLEELKVFFFEYPLILLGMAVLFRVKKELSLPTLYRLLAATVLGWVLGLYCTWLVMPSGFRVLVGLKSYARYEETSSVAYKISRLRAFQMINDLFFHGDKKLLLFGYGFGNCDYSAFAPLTSDFYRTYGDYNYLWCAHQTLFLEGGAVGFVLYVLIFVQLMVQGLLKWHRTPGLNRATALLIVFSGVVLISVIYNNTLRTEISYLTYFALAAGLAVTAAEAGKKQEKAANH